MRLQPAMGGAGGARDARPLAGRRIVVTRARGQAGALARALTALGAEIVAAPTIRIESLPTDALAPLRAALADLSSYRWIVFTSRNAVDVVWQTLDAWPLPQTPDFARVAVAAIGPRTADALARHGVRPQVVPKRFVAEAVVDALAARGPLAGARVLLPRAAGARDALPDGLRALGADVDVIPVYRTVPEAGDGGGLAAAIAAGRIDAITFTSSSTVRGFVTLVGRPAATSGLFAAAVIGPVTAATAREAGIPVAVEAEEFTTTGLVAALVGYFRKGGRRKREG